MSVNASTGDAAASGLLDHTAALGGPSQTGNISTFGVDLEGELYVVSYSRGVVLKLVGTPPAPRDLRIIR
jgi:hypothetical protein